MRKFLVLMAGAVLVASSTGCGCCGKLRNWFHKGSPCGTRVAPAVLGAPLTMAAPPMMMSAPVQCVESAPMCMPCDPCADPCASGYTTGYMGYSDGVSMGAPVGCSSCGGDVGGIPVVEGQTYVPSSPTPATLAPAPSDSRYDPRPAGN